MNKGERIMRIQPISYSSNNYSNVQNSRKLSFTSNPPANMDSDMFEEMTDLKVFKHHIYEYKKGIRTLILTTEKSKHREAIEKRLQKEKIDYVIHDLPNKNTINVYFGEKPCIDVIKTFNPKLNKITPEQDFMLGIMLGYDKVKQCLRYLDFKKNNKLK
jgi:hypothetical protein